MGRIVIGSVRPDAGKTTLIVGLGKALGGRFGYMKPFGDRLIYKKKQLWDYDCSLVVSIFGMTAEDYGIPLGFDQAKLRFMYDQRSIEEKLQGMADKAGEGRDKVIIEAGRDIAYGSFVGLDSVSLARTLGARLIVVVDGNENRILDDVVFIKKRIDLSGATLDGVVVNKIPNLEDFRDNYLKELESIGISVMGLIPFVEDLTHHTVDLIVQKTMAKVLCGEKNLARTVKTILVGAMSAEAVQRHPSFLKEKILLITSGDRSDLLLAAIHADIAAILLTNSLIPPPAIVSAYQDKGIPLLLSPHDTYVAANEIHRIDPLLSRDDADRLRRIETLVADHVNLKALLS